MFGDEDVLGCEVGGGGGAIIVGVLRPVRPLKGSCDEALRLRLFCNGLWTGSLGKEWLSGGGVTGVKGLTDDIIAAIRRCFLGWDLGYIYECRRYAACSGHCSEQETCARVV
jgi:hypothetical protein